jgi:two-component system, chemotaxis family, chemotaxis protein CheY
MGLNVLVVDDSSTMRSMVKKTIKMSGIPLGQTFEASNGIEGLEILEKEWIDIVFVDINMPVMGGLEMIDKVREKTDLAEVPIVVISTESSQTRIQEIHDRGLQFIHKPFTPERIHEVVTSLLDSLHFRMEPKVEILEKIGREVLETMAFALILTNETSDLRIENLTSASVNFRGPFNGLFTLTVTDSIMLEIVENMLGSDEEPALNGGQINDAIGELANVMCGNLLAEMAGPEPVFFLDAPIVKTNVDGEHDENPGPKAAVRLKLENGWVELKLKITDEKKSAMQMLSVNSVTG